MVDGLQIRLVSLVPRLRCLDKPPPCTRFSKVVAPKHLSFRPGRPSNEVLKNSDVALAIHYALGTMDAAASTSRPDLAIPTRVRGRKWFVFRRSIAASLPAGYNY